MRVELKRLQQELQQTLIYVTHDQVEAMSMADRIAVLNLGVLQQCDTPDAIYSLPANRFVATVIGSPPTNFIPAAVSRAAGALTVAHPTFTLRAPGEGHPLAAALPRNGDLPDKIIVGVRPEDLRVFTANPGPDALPAQVSVIEPLGGETVIDLLLGPDIIKAVIPPDQQLSEGQAVWIRLDPERIHFFDAATSARRYTTGQVARLECVGRTPA
jgi:multiple sugar transport system ATP-binding protein